MIFVIFDVFSKSSREDLTNPKKTKIPTKIPLVNTVREGMAPLGSQGVKLTVLEGMGVHFRESTPE